MGSGVFGGGATAILRRRDTGSDKGDGGEVSLLGRFGLPVGHAAAFVSSGAPKRPPARWVRLGIAGLKIGLIRRYLGSWGRD